MAKKQTEKFVDITKTGAQSYRDLQSQNNLPESADKIASFADASKYFKYTGQQAIANNQAANAQWEDYQEQSPLYRQTGGADYLGNSIYDDDIIVGDDDYNHISDIRGRNQSWYAQLGAGLTKGVGLAGTTFLDGTLGLVWGGMEAIAQGDISKLWDNEISNGLHDFNKSMEEWLPNYRTEEEQNRSWYENLGTMNFWADSFLKNMGFTVGALYSGGVWTKGLKGLGALTKTLGAETLGTAMQTNGLGAKLTGSLFSAVNEGRIEANNNTADLRDLQVQQASDAFAQRRQEIIDNPTLSEDEKIAQMAELDGNYQATLDQIDENLKKAGLTDFLLNVPILAIDNFWTFGRMYAQGFNNARNVAGKNVKKSFLGRASQAANEAADAAENTLAQNTKKKAGRYAWNEITKKQSIGKGLMTGLREGNEEMAQAWAAEFAGNNAFYSDGPDTYYRAMSDPKALQETMSSWEAASKAFANTYGNLDRYEEFAIGALTGLLGTPTFGRSQNASANTWLGRGKMVGLSGGILGEFKSDAEMNKNGYAHVTNMNAALDKRDQIDKTVRVHAAMNQFNNAMDGFAESDDKFEYQNASDNLDWMGITSFISTGRERDLKILLGQDFDNISDEELEAIAAFTAQNDDSNVGGFREKGSGRLITTNSPQSDKDEMRQKMNRAKEKMLDEVDSYKTSVDIIRNYAAGNPNVTEEEINELAWMHWKTSRFDRRASEIKQDNAEQFTLIAQALEDFKKKQQEVIDREEESTEGLSATAMSIAENRNAQLSKAKKDAQKNLEYADELLGIINSVADNNKSIMPFLAPMLQMDKSFLDGVLKSDNFYNLAINRGLSKPEFDKAIRDIRDLGRLAEANKTFNDKLKEYMEDPLKQKNDHAKADAENDIIAQEINKETNRKRAKKATRQQILKGEVDADDVIKNTKTDDVERQMAQDAKVTAQVGQKLESMIAKQNQEGTLSNEDAARIESTIQQGIAQSQSINDLTGANAAFMVDANGQPLSDEQIALIQDLIDKATKEVAEANSLNIKDGEIDFSKVEEAVQSQTGPTEKQAKAIEEAITKEETKTTGNDAVEKAVAANSNGVQGDPEKAIRKGRPNRGFGKSQQRGKKNGNVSVAEQLKKSKKEKEAATKAAEEKARHEAIAKKKNSIISTALPFAINGNIINVSTPEGQQEAQLLSNILSKAYDLINEGKIEKLSGIMKVLKSMDEFEKLQQMLGRDPNLGSAIKSISDNLKKEFTPEEDSNDDAAKLERTLGPETVSNETASPASFSSQNLNPVINIPNYFAPATSQYYRDPKTGQILPVPFTAKMQPGNKARKKKLEETYNYLTKNEAFKNASKVKAGDSIYFTIHPNLNTAAGDVVILMSTDPEGKHIVGDLADTESYTYENNILLKSMIDRITKEFNERENKDSSDPFVSKETSTVRQSMIGHVMFTDSKNTAGDKTLNRVFGDGQFKMGVANKVGGIITTNQGDESVSGNFDIVTPKTRFTHGTPVVLIPSGEGINRYVAVPFQMSKYDSSMRGSKFHKYAEVILKRVLLNKNGEPIDFSSHASQDLIAEGFQALFNGLFRVNFRNGQLEIQRLNKTVKDGILSKEYETLYRGIPNASIVNNILNALQAKGMTIRIDRREINKESNLKDLDFSYNTMMGDLAHTNLSDKSSTTVNDWFVVNPVNEKGEEIEINRVEYRNTRTEKTPTQRNDTKVTYKDNEYLVSEEDVVVDKDGNPRTDVNVTDQQIILAKAEIEKNDLITPIGIEGEQIFWYSLGNGNLFYNKDGEERVVVSEADKQEVKDNLTKKQEYKSQKSDNIFASVDNIKNLSLGRLSDLIGLAKPYQVIAANIDAYLEEYENYKRSGDKSTLSTTNKVTPEDTIKFFEDLEARKAELSTPSEQKTVTPENISEYIQIINTYQGMQEILPLQEWSKKTGDARAIVRDHKTGWYEYNGLTFYVQFGTQGRGGDNLSIWFKDSPSSSVRQQIEKWLKQVKRLNEFDTLSRILNGEQVYSTQTSSGQQSDTIDHEYRAVGGKTITVKVDKNPVSLKDLKPGDEFFDRNNWIVTIIKSLGNNEYLVRRDGTTFVIGPKANWGDWVSSNPKVYRINQEETHKATQAATAKLMGVVPKKESSKKKYPNGFNSQDQKDFFDAMSKERQQQLMEANSNAISSVLSYINSIMNNIRDIKYLNEAEDDINNIFNMLEDIKYRKVEEVEEYTPADLKAEKEWLKKALPQLSDDDHFRIVNVLIKIARKDNPGYAYGKTQQGIMTISNAAATGTVYHEAFHSVIDILLTDEEVNSLFKSGAKKYGIERSNLDNELAIEENLAEDFRRYVQRERAYKKELEQSSGLSKIFKILKHTAKTWIDNISYINNMFYRINQGQLANRSLRNNRNVERYNQYTAEEKAILDKAPRDSQGRLLAPNGELSNLTEKQYAQVRTKAFKEWFGDWEKTNTFNIDAIDTSKVDIEEHNKPWKNDPIKNNKTLRIYIKGQREKGYFELVKDQEFGIFSVHFKTGNANTGEIYGSTKEERSILYKQLLNAIPNGAQLSTWGELSEGGIKALNKLGKNLKKVGERQVKDRQGNSISIPIYQKGEGVSKVVDENGEPLVVYHGSNNKFTTFSYDYFGRHDTGSLGKTFYFSHKNVAEAYAEEAVDNYGGEKTLYPVFLNIRNLATDEIDNETPINFDNPLFKDYDGAFVWGWQYAVRNPNQIKSATDNIGTFDANNPDIRYRKSTITLEAIQKYHQEKLDYSNLDDTQKALLEDRGISEEQYSFLTQAEKENLRMCLI